jgi:hypothetical protein
MLLSINQLSELTDIDRHTVAASLKDLPFVAGEKNAYLYHAAKALSVLYRADNLEVARAKQALSQASLNAVREEFMNFGHMFKRTLLTSR